MVLSDLAMGHGFPSLINVLYMCCMYIYIYIHMVHSFVDIWEGTVCTGPTFIYFATCSQQLPEHQSTGKEPVSTGSVLTHPSEATLYCKKGSIGILLNCCPSPITKMETGPLSKLLWMESGHPQFLTVYIWIYIYIYTHTISESLWFSFLIQFWQCVKTNSTPSVHIKIAGIYGCSSH